MSPQVLNDATAAGRPALGTSFTFMTDVTLWLARALGQDHEIRTAQVLRSRVSVSRRSPPLLFLFTHCACVLMVFCCKATGTRCAFRIRHDKVLAS